MAEPSMITRRGATRGKRLVRSGLGDVRVSELTRTHVRQWWHGLPVKAKEASCRQAYDLLRAILNEALDDELIDFNPVRIKDASRAQAGRERDLDPLPIHTLFAVADAMPGRYRLGVSSAASWACDQAKCGACSGETSTSPEMFRR